MTAAADSPSRPTHAPLPPPAPGALPLAGHAIQWVRQPVPLMRRAYEQVGPIFTIRLGRRRAAVLIGSEHSRFFFRETDESLSIGEAYRWMVPMFGDKFPLTACVADHRRYRAVYARPFSPERLAGYIPTMAHESRAWLDRLGDEGRFEVVDSFERLQLRIAARTVLGAGAQAHLGGSLADLFADLAARSRHNLIRNLPLPDPRRRRARRRLVAALRQELAQPNGGDGGEDTFLSDFAAGTDSNGEPIPEETAIDLALGMVWASYPTSTGHLCWGLVHLLQHPEFLEPIVAEGREVLDGAEVPDPEAVGRLRRLEWSLRESERLQPAVRVLGRRTARPYELGGYGVPAGWTTLVSPAVTHRLPHAFPDPDRYDPERFSPERDRASGQSASRQLIGFGGGVHICPGRRFAYTAMKVILSQLLGRYRLELLTPDPAPSSGPTPGRPRGPVMVRYSRR